ncbi:hypothetical protein JR316_0007355 [Psilocybe cubensis]|uniref:Uncharacterized protein n=1 Tax=Psilocybe cubensis TaxID=181762 RepID=A0ACB8H0N0_PSICU|nr:hypothetical protein JR316_0007355 [Psilocybe cubensis]KAH9480755.1 hypothetical protein JR316_0007355 [Psilocybe cubensis]
MKTTSPKDSIVSTLPPDLIEAIGDKLEIEDVKQLRLTCNTMADLLQPHIFRSVTLCIHGDNYQQGVEKLEALARSTHPACYAARALTIRTLSPGYAPRSFGPIALLKANNSIDLFEKDPFEVSTAKDRIINHLLDAITSLQGVRAVQ